LALNIARAKDKARNFEVKNQTDKAIATYVDVLQTLEGTPELDEELPLFNKVGDLYQKAGNIQAAVEMWERGAGRYAEGGFHNNAIALCNKILRNAPGRTQTYLTLAKLMLKRGFVAEAKQNLLEYAERMKKAGQLEAAFKALREFADLSSGANEDMRLLLAEQLKAAGLEDQAREQLAKLYHETKGDARRSRATMEKMKALDPGYDATSVPPPKVKEHWGKSSDLVFLNLDEDEPVAEAPPAPLATAAPAARPPDLPLLDLEPTSLVEEPPASPVQELHVERSSVEFDSSGVEAGTMDGLTGAVLEPPAGTLPPDAFEPTSVGPTAAEVEPAEAMPLIEIEKEEESRGVPALDLGGFGGGASDMDLGVGGAVALPEIDLDIEVPAAPAGPPDVATLEARVADNPDDAQLHRALGEALVETGARERGLEELDIALGLWEGQNEWGQAEDLTDEVLRLDPNSVRHHQKRVEFAFRRNDRGRLIDAYLGLSDALMRSGALERARAVYQRVLEHDAQNARALSALATLEPAAEAVKPAKGARPAAPAPAAAAHGDFVDLGALVLDEPTNIGDARLRVQDEEPTGDEQRDFDDMLAQFKKGIEASLGADDVQAHYDLGIAFKEMGLIDEAIAEFQKALRGAEGRMRTSEALGSCFFEKGQYTVAATVLRRAVETDAGGDEAKIGLLYWLGRCEEEMGRLADALNYYQRVFAVDIGFQDVSGRVKSLAKAGR